MSAFKVHIKFRWLYTCAEIEVRLPPRLPALARLITLFFFWNFLGKFHCNFEARPNSKALFMALNWYRLWLLKNITGEIRKFVKNLKFQGVPLDENFWNFPKSSSAVDEEQKIQKDFGKFKNFHPSVSLETSKIFLKIMHAIFKELKQLSYTIWNVWSCFEIATNPKKV